MTETVPVEIHTKSGWVLVPGEVYGVWAVTEATTRDREQNGFPRYVVTHVPTGTVAVRYDRKSDARKAARAGAKVATGPAWASDDMDAIRAHWRANPEEHEAVRVALGYYTAPDFYPAPERVLKEQEGG